MKWLEIIKETATGNDPRFQFHLSVEPGLIAGKSFAAQTRTVSQSGSRGDAGDGNGEIYTTHNLFHWASQIAYEAIGEFPNHVYLVFVREGGRGTIDAAHQDMSPPQDVIVLLKVGESDPDSDAVPDYGRMMWKADQWIKRHGQAVIALYGDNIVTESVEDPDFKAWFGASKIVRDGRPMMVFHQTGVDNAAAIETHGFDIERLGARASDDTMPDGIFFKPTTEDIGVGGKKTVQMPFFLSIQNPLRVRDRDALREFLFTDESYRQFADKVHAVDTQLAKSYDKLGDRGPPGRGRRASTLKPMVSWDAWNAASAKLAIQCERYLNKVATVARARATAVIKAHGYDGLWMAADRGGGLLGDRHAPTTIVAFSRTQVRSAKAERQAAIDRSWGR